MIEKISTCLIETCTGIGINENAIFPARSTPEIIQYDPSARFEILDSTHRFFNPRIERRLSTTTHCQILKVFAEISTLVNLSFISVSENSLENLHSDFLKNIPATIARDEYMDIIIRPLQSNRGDYEENTGDPVDYKRLTIKIQFDSESYESTVEPLVKNINLVPTSYST